jgi:hypothetical protein
MTSIFEYLNWYRYMLAYIVSVNDDHIYMCILYFILYIYIHICYNICLCIQLYNLFIVLVEINSYVYNVFSLSNCNALYSNSLPVTILLSISALFLSVSIFNIFI